MYQGMKHNFETSSFMGNKDSGVKVHLRHGNTDKIIIHIRSQKAVGQWDGHIPSAHMITKRTLNNSTLCVENHISTSPV